MTIVMIDPTRHISTDDAASGCGSSSHGFAPRPIASHAAAAQEKTKNKQRQ
jgi:hypothetical protein